MFQRELLPGLTKLVFYYLPPYTLVALAIVPLVIECVPALQNHRLRLMGSLTLIFLGLSLVIGMPLALFLPEF